MKFTVKQNAHSYSGHGCWYISDENNNNYLGRDLEIHGSTWCYASCSWVGYYKSKEEAEQFLKLFKEKYNAAENKMVISVKVNGMPVPLHEISEQTLLAIRASIKSKPVPVFQVCDARIGSRLIFKVTKEMADRVDRYVALNQHGRVMSCGVNVEGVWCRRIYSNLRELKLDEV